MVGIARSDARLFGGFAAALIGSAMLGPTCPRGARRYRSDDRAQSGVARRETEAGGGSGIVSAGGSLVIASPRVRLGEDDRRPEILRRSATRVTVLEHDRYYRDRNELRLEERRR